MKHESKGRPFKPEYLLKAEAKDLAAPKEKSEAAEVAAKHKNNALRPRQFRAGDIA